MGTLSNAIRENKDQEILILIMDELNSITQCPYPASLKKLEIFLTKTDDKAIRLWATNFPCRALVLVQKVCDGLKFSASALVIIERLSRLETFRSLILEQEPKILPILIHQALHTDTHVQQHLDICTNLLSYPLHGLPLPDKTEHFVFKICDLAAQHPSIKNIARLYRIVRGPCRELLVALPHQTLHRLEERVIGIVKVTKVTDEDSPILFSISILASLKQAHDEHSLQSGILHHAAYEFFHGTKCTKTMQLVLLRAVWACKDSSATPFEGAVGCLRLAREIFENIDSNILNTWRLDNAPIIRKLVEKVSSCHLDSETLCEGAALLSIILGSQDIPVSIVNKVGKSILSPKNSGILDGAGYPTLKQVFCSFMHLLDNDFFTLLLEKAFNHALEPAAKDLYQLEYSIFLLQTFDKIMQENAAVATIAQKALSSQRLSFLLNDLLEKSTLQHEAVDGHNENFCLRAFYESQRHLQLAIISLSLKSSLSVESVESRLPVSIIQRLINQQVKLCVPLKQCKEHLNCADSNFMFMPESEKDNAYFTTRGTNWRELLAVDLKAKAVEQAQQTVQVVERICRDFENRCESIEEPLRKEEQKSIEAQNSVCRLEDQVKTLGAEATDRILYLDGLEAEKTELEIMVKKTIAQNSTLMGHNEELRRLLKETNDEKSRIISAERSEKDALDFQYKTRLTANEVEIEKLQLDLGSLKSQNRELKAQIDENEAEKSLLNKDIESLRANLISCEEESKALASKLSEKEKDSLNAEKNEKELKDALRVVHIRLEETNEQIQQTMSENSLSMASLKTELENLTAMQASDLKKSVEDELNRSQRQICKLEDERKNALITIKDLETRIQNIEDSNEALVQELHVKENELEEGQELRVKLFALVGGKSLDMPQIKPSENLMSRRVLPTRTRSDAFLIQASESKDLLQSSGSSGSSSRKSPTPKRMRKVFKVPTMKQPRFSPNKFPSRPQHVGKSDATRSPLSNASPGRYNLMPHLVEPRLPNREGEAIKDPFSPIQTFKSSSVTVSPKNGVRVGDINDCEELESYPSSTISSTLNLLISPRHECIEADDDTMGY